MSSNSTLVSAWSLESGGKWTAETVDARLLPLKRKRKLYGEILDLDPTTLVAQGRCPVLIVQGAADVQVGVKDAKFLTRACQVNLLPENCHFA
ncbi:MAG: hypothetical protein HQL36_02485 [Alphaproteobacteria bacterium]|nr:hypothetical protein [Alphaproteobacteria bacterium]